ncbi:related to CLOCK-CONTROLLED PROTEIN 6 (CCG-6) [Phialocephala subalpina]|uniref:Related to CLOCK-CONTROLLED PROTEIN 6 (CCG-6) n=1 Tax=Phialocephala subalpina TaxID=576137 RepID=A0A1L7X427_9HELO|nr:related to CLOCK-CONTROLLED PROTEIN 6 (CCG-6) [Phialocephala subalpina]
MQFSTLAAITALAATVSAGYNGTVVYTTEVHTAYTTVCPASTELTFNGVTYTATASTTLTITNCPCTIVKPVTTSSVVYCNTCAPVSSAPVYANTTVAAATTYAAASTTKGSVGTSSAKSSATATPSTITASGANKAFALSGASLAGVLGLAAYFL